MTLPKENQEQALFDRRETDAEGYLLCLDLQERILEISADEDLRDYEDPARHLSTKRLEELFLALVRTIEAERSVEIGAFEGGYSRQVKKSLPDCHVVAFEANPENAAKFADGLAAAGVELHNMALSNRIGTVSFNVPMNGEDQPIERMGSINDLSWARRGSRNFTVPCTTLDEFFAKEVPATALWIDVEGHAAEVLQGGRRFLHNCALCYIELETEARWIDQKTDEYIFDLLYEAGLVPIARDVQRKKWQYNAVFIRREILESPSLNSIIHNYFDNIISKK